MTKQTIVDEPLQTNENGDHNDEKQSIWTSILRDVKSSTKKAPTTKSLVVLGDNESGRTTLVAKLQGNEDPKRGAGLEYHYIDVKDDDRDDTPKLGVWILDGDAACSAPLLKYAMKSETLENTLLIFVASMTQPWSILSTLVKWTKLIEEHLDRLQIDPTRLREMRDHLQYDFQHYIEANDSSTTIKSSSGGGRVPSSVSLASNTPLSPTNGDDQIILPLPDGVLTRSLGIPVIVVITKCDVMSVLEKENDYKDEYFDFMQHHLRKFCLEYGAALFYTSVKERKNIDKLYKYIVHKCYGYPFPSSAAIVERDAICIPSGWDNPKKADILLENLHRLKSAENYSDVFVKPALRRPLQRDNDVVMAEDDQEFLAKLQLTLNRATSPSRGNENQQTPPPQPPPGKKPPIPTPNDATRANETALSVFFGTLLAKKSGGAATPTSASPITQRQTIQSPTTPSAKRLQQHPLTFAVTPPPGRSRTPTPTSHKTFPSSLNIESPPKALSPVVEQQSKVEANLTPSVSPTIVRTPIEDNEPVKSFNGIEDKQSSDHTRQLEDDLNSISNTEILNSPSPSSSSSLIEHTPKDFLLSHNITSEQSPITEIVENNDQSNDKDRDENRINPIVSQEETSQPSIEDASLNHDEQQEDLTKSPNTSRRNTATNERIRSRPSSPILNESQQQQDQTLPDADAGNIHSEQLDRRVSSSDIRQSEMPGENLLTDQPPQQPSTSSVNTGNEEQPEQTLISLSDTNNNHDHALLLAESFDENPALLPERHIDSPSNTEHHSIIKTASFDHTPYSPTKNQQNHSPTEDHDLQKSPNHEAALSPFHTIQGSQSTTLIESPTFESSDIKPESHEDTTVSPTLQDEKSRSRSSSPTTKQDQQRSRSPSPTVQQERLRSRSSSPISKQERLRSRSSSPISKQERSRSPSLTTEQDQERSQSPLLNIEQKQNRSRSPSPVIEQQSDRNRSPSPIIQQGQQRSRSPSPNTKQEQLRNRSPSPSNKQDQEQNPSSSLTSEQKQESSRSPSPVVEQQPDRNRYPSPIAKRKQSRSRSSSPTNKQDQQRNQSSPLISEQKQERSRSPSPATKHEQERSRSPSPTVQQERQRSRSPSLITKEDQQRSRSPSPITEQDQERSQSALVNIEQKQNRSRSPSLTAKQEQEESQSSSPVIEQQPDRNRSPSPIANQEQERSRSPSPVVQEGNQRSESPSPITGHEQERSGSPSSDIEHKQELEQIQSESPVKEQNQQRSRSPSPVNEENEEKNRSASPITVQDQDQDGGRKLSYERDEGKEKSHPPSPTTERREETNQSSILPSEEKFEQSRPTSPAIEQNLVQSRSADPVLDWKLDRKQSTSAAVEQTQNRSRSPSPTAEMKETQNLSSSSPSNENRERSRSPSPDIGRKEAQSPTLISASLDEREERSPLSLPIHEEQHKDSSHIESPAKTTDFIKDNGPISQISDDHEETEIPSSPKLEGNQLPRLSTDRNDAPTHLVQENTGSSSMMRESKQADRSQSSSPTDQQETSVTNIKDKNDISPLPSPLQSSQPLKSSVPEKRESHSIKQRSASDRQHESISPAPVVRRPSITRSKSQSAVVRPNTLHFTPNNHDLDGLYMSNDYDDEDDILDDSEHHHNSAPSTVRVEQRRSSLFYNDNTDQQQKSIDPEDISRRLSRVEKSRMEDHGNHNADPTNSTGT